MWRVKDPYLAPAPLRSFRQLAFKGEFEMASAGGWFAIGG
jgi:hypothetical protein